MPAQELMQTPALCGIHSWGTNLDELLGLPASDFGHQAITKLEFPASWS